jgi:hypothetical protein
VTFVSTDDGVAAGEPTFADVLNGLSLSGHRTAKLHHAETPAPQPIASRSGVLDDPDGEVNASSVRAYAWTGGRTTSDFHLEIETLVSTSRQAEQQLTTLRTEHQSVARLCRDSRSVAEVGALLSLPLGVVRVLLGDMATLGLIDVHSNPIGRDERPDLDLMERVLRGLTNLRA